VEFLDIKESIEREFKTYLPDKVELDVVEGANKQSFLRALDTQPPYHILHFAGHGAVTDDGVGRLLLQHQRTGRSELITAVGLASTMRNRGLHLVVLSACSTAAGDFGKEFAVVARTLVENNVPAVVANQFPITNSAAATFAGAFYRELLRSGDVDQATTNGRVELNFGQESLANGEARFEWGIPTVYRHVGGAKVFK
jgi:CHAT domain-containing protein